MTQRLTYFTGLMFVFLIAFFNLIPALAAPPPVTTPAVVSNPDLQATCGTKVIFVLDESGSLGSIGFNAVRSAMSAFLDGLKNTGSQVAIIEFSTEARFPVNYTPVTDTTVSSTFTPYLYGGDYGSGGSTNWDDALDLVKQLNQTAGAAPLVVFMTDGVPNVYHMNYDGEPGGLAVNSTQAFWRAIDEANLIKMQGSHILSLGIGTSIETSTLPFISGADMAPPQPFDISTSDVMVVTNFALLAQSVRSIATQLCGSSITLTKFANQGDGLGYVAKANQSFTTHLAAHQSGAEFEWTSPQGGNSTSITGATNNAGKAVFQFRASGNFKYDATLVEPPLPDYRLIGAQCDIQTNGGLVATVTPSMATNSFTLFNVNTTDIVTCNVFNATVGLTVEKYVSTSPDGPWVESLVLDAPAHIYWFINITNTGGLAINLSVSDSDVQISQCAGSPMSLPPNTSSYCLIDGGMSQPGTHVNTIAVTGCNQQTGLADICKMATDTALYKAPTPNVAVSIQGGTTSVSVGDTVTHTITVTNTGESPLTNLVMDAPNCGAITDLNPLGTGESRDYTCIRTVGAGDNNGSDGLTQPVTVTTAEGVSASASATTPLGGRIVVVKVTPPDGIGLVFDFQTSFGGGILQVASGSSATSDVLIPGSYSVTELEHAGWQPNGSSCDDSSTTGAIQLAALETVTCTFINARIITNGSITLTHHVNWNDMPVDPAQTFTICIDATIAEPCRLFGADSGAQSWIDLPVGDYTLTMSPTGDQWSSDWGSLPISITTALSAPNAVLNTQRVCGALDRNPRAHLRTNLDIDWRNNITIGRVRNSSSICSYEIGLVSYEKPTEVLADQRIFAWSPDTTQPGKVPPETGSGAIVPPNGDITLQVPLPMCAAQIDLFYDADALYPTLYSDPAAISALAIVPLVLDQFETGRYGQYGNRYGNRLLQALHTNQIHRDIPLCGALAAPEAAAFSLAAPAEMVTPLETSVVATPDASAESSLSEADATATSDVVPPEATPTDMPTSEAVTPEILPTDTPGADMSAASEDDVAAGLTDAPPPEEAATEAPPAEVTPEATPDDTTGS